MKRLEPRHQLFPTSELIQEDATQTEVCQAGDSRRIRMQLTMRTSAAANSSKHICRLEPKVDALKIFSISNLPTV